MSTKKAGGTASNLKNSPGQRLGVKVYGGTPVRTGGIIVRQRGTLYGAGTNVLVGRDHTLYARIDGVVRFAEKRVIRYDRKHMRKTIVNVDPINNGN